MVERRCFEDARCWFGALSIRGVPTAHLARSDERLTYEEFYEDKGKARDDAPLESVEETGRDRARNIRSELGDLEVQAREPRQGASQFRVRALACYTSIDQQRRGATKPQKEGTTNEEDRRTI